MSILIKNVSHNRQLCDLRIDGNKITNIAPQISGEADVIVDGRNKAVLPAFYNLHTHASMSLLKGISDDKELFAWLSEDIWPRESKFDDEMIYIGAKLAILEMIKSGTVFFSDMYFNYPKIMQAAEEMGVRAAVSIVGFDLFDPAQTAAKKAATDEFIEFSPPVTERIFKSLSIHSVYTVSEELIRFMVQKAKQQDLFLHIHASETSKEVADCICQHGCSPIAYLEKLGALGPKTILAHAVHLDAEDIKIIKKHQVSLVTNPSSNCKLASGIFSFDELQQAGILIGLGTDSSASNNGLSMFSEMKLCSLLAKTNSGSPCAGKIDHIYQAATRNGAQIFGLDAGQIAIGKLADCILVDLNNPLLVPDHNLISNLIYAADSSVVDTVICDGRILMQNRQVEGEEAIIAEARRLADKLR